MTKTANETEKSHNRFIRFWHRGFGQKLFVIILALLVTTIGVMYGISQWYIQSQKDKPLELGTSFIPYYAESLGVDPQETMDELIGIGVKHFRLVSYWNVGEQQPGVYNFDDLDWQFQKAEDANAKVLLTLGLRQPRWPECHMPKWAEELPRSQWQPALEKYIEVIVNRYKDSPALDKYQLENEYFLKGFGECTDFSRDRLVSEYNLVKKLDPSKEIVVPRSNNALGFPVGKPLPDEFSISIYKRVWDAGVSKRYLEYPFPAWFYGYIAGVQMLYSDRNMILGELQGEAWPPHGKPIPQVSLDEQNKSINAKRLADRFKFGEATGMREIYLWGGEYWYYRKAILNDPSLWNVAKEEFKTSE